MHTDFSRGRSGGLVSHLFQNFPQFIVIHTVKGFGIVNKAEIYVFLELSCFYHDPVDVGNLIPAKGSMKDRNGMDLTEADDIKKRWQEYTEELYKPISSRLR